MNKNDLKILGLEEGATKEEITNAYNVLRAKYLEDRFLDGEEGNKAARMLTKIDAAYSELMSEISQSETSAENGGGAAFDKVEEYIKSGNISEAQRLLDTFNERGAHWHYLQSVVYYKKHWVNESKKQLEIAINLDGENEKYKQAYQKLVDKIKYDENAAQNAKTNGYGENGSVYSGQDMNYADDGQMGGNACSQCAYCCYMNLCLNCLCNSCMGGCR